MPEVTTPHEPEPDPDPEPEPAGGPEGAAGVVGGVPATARDPLRRSRASSLWVGVVAFGVVLLLLVVFIAQNTQRVQVSFLGWDGHPPLAVALLLAAVGGLLVTATAGTVRIWQVRRRVRGHRSQTSGA